MTSAFDPAAFLDATQTDINERRALLPVENPADQAGLYTATIGEIKPADGIIGKGDRAGEPWLAMVVPLLVDVPQQLQDSLKLPSQVTLVDRAFIDMLPGGTGIDNAPGKNARQKEYRDATGMNVLGQTFSWRALQGRVVKIKVTHEIYNDTPQERLPKYGAIFKA